MPANADTREALGRFLRSRGVEPEPAVGRIEAYEGLIRRWSMRGNLVSRRDLERLRERHVVDSLTLLQWWSGNLADVGSGAGFPGLPLAIARPESSVTLIERSERKVRFLRQVTIELGLANVEVIETDVGHGHGRGFFAGRLFDTVTARAVAPPSASWKLLRGLLAPKGVALFQSADQLDAARFPGGGILACQPAGHGWVTVVGPAAPRRP